MSVNARIPTINIITSSLPETNKIRLSSPTFEISPIISLANLSDVIDANVKNDEALIYSSSSDKFIPTDITNIRNDITTINRVVGGNF